MLIGKVGKKDVAALGGRALALLQDVLFDAEGEYFIAAPLDSKDEAALALERLALALEAVRLIALTALATPEQAKSKLKNRNSRFASCNEFRVYQVEYGAWAHILELIGAPEPIIAAARRRQTVPATALPAPRRGDPAGYFEDASEEPFTAIDLTASDRTVSYRARP